MTLRRRQARFSAMLGFLLVKAASLKTPVCILELYRSIETQRAYVSRGASKTMKSKHLEGLAVDLAFLDDIEDDGKINYTPDKYKALGEYWESLGGRWGGRFGVKPEDYDTQYGWDCMHFEYQEKL